jgi:hypothetical protein
MVRVLDCESGDASSILVLHPKEFCVAQTPYCYTIWQTSYAGMAEWVKAFRYEENFQDRILASYRKNRNRCVINRRCRRTTINCPEQIG